MKKLIVLALMIFATSSFASTLNCNINSYGEGLKEYQVINLDEYFFDEEGFKLVFLTELNGYEYILQSHLDSPDTFIISAGEKQADGTTEEIFSTIADATPTLIHTNNKISITCAK